LEERYALLATNEWILVLIRITMRVQEILNGILLLRDRGWGKNFARSADVEEVCGLRVLLVRNIILAVFGRHDWKR